VALMPPACVSVVMPVFNAGPFLDEAIRSILGQTLTELEFVIADDGSTDGSRERVERWARTDSRIRLLDSAGHRGLAGTSNAVACAARCDLIARMDADDVSHPTRLARQVAVLNRAPDIALVGTLAEGIDAAGRRVRSRDRWRLLRSSIFVPFPHGSVMFRRSAFDAIGGYAEAAAGVEDQDFCYRMRGAGRVVTLPEALYQYRYHQLNATLGRDGPGHLDRGSIWGRQTNRHFARGAVRLWSGERPRALAGLVRDRAAGRWATLPMLAWAAWGSVSPRSLRWCLRSVIVARDRLSGLSIKDGGVYEWRFARLS
jgi:glycosyltransferase involved in cell wall biosynthesis